MKKFIAVIISLFCLTAVFAEDWYVCLGSFTKKENLETYITALEKNKIPTFTQPYTDKKGVNWIRVFYDEAFKNPDTARMVRDSLQPKKVFKDFKMDGLWICQTTKAAAPARKYSAADLDSTLPFIEGFNLALVKHYNFNVISKISPNFTVGEEVFIDDIKDIADSMVTARYKKSYSTIDINVCLSEEGFPEISFDGLEKVAVNLPEIDATYGYIVVDGNITNCFVMSSSKQIFYGISGKNVEKDALVQVLNGIKGAKLIERKAAVGSILETAPDMARVMYTYTDAIDLEDDFIVGNPDWMDYLSGNWSEDSLVVDGYNFFFEFGIDSDDAQALFENFLAGTEGEGAVKEVNGKKVWFFGNATSSQREAVFADESALFFIITEASEEALLEEVSKR
ncbi:MAG: SPOR domain-containing protein [Treponema sp.]|nr:SPOR domain-containing protein [Treponema sp.]